MKLSVIIPVLNEAANLPGLIFDVQNLHSTGIELIFVDGGSKDDGVAIIETANLRCILGPRGRARQMNAGAELATGDAFLFLHADTRLPAAGDALILAQLRRGVHVWGRFNVRITGRAAMLSVVACMMNWRSRITGIATGDQAIFVTRAAFNAVGGFPDQPLMEDIELSRRLNKISAPACLCQRVTTSGRRWETRGVWKTIFLMWRLRWAYWRGVSADEIARQYQ